MTNSAVVLNSCHRAHEVLVLSGPPQITCVTEQTCVRLRKFVFEARHFVCSARYCTVRQEYFWLLQVPYFIWQILFITSCRSADRTELGWLGELATAALSQRYYVCTVVESHQFCDRERHHGPSV